MLWKSNQHFSTSRFPRCPVLRVITYSSMHYDFEARRLAHEFRRRVRAILSARFDHLFLNRILFRRLSVQSLCCVVVKAAVPSDSVRRGRFPLLGYRSAARGLTAPYVAVGLHFGSRPVAQSLRSVALRRMSGESS